MPTCFAAGDLSSVLPKGKVECSRADREVLILRQTDTRLSVRDELQTRHNSPVSFQHSGFCWRLLHATQHCATTQYTLTHSVETISIVHEVRNSGSLCLFTHAHTHTPVFTQPACRSIKDYCTRYDSRTETGGEVTVHW